MTSIASVNLKTHPLGGVSLIEASAGTGKTFTITHLYVRCLLETDFQVNQLLVVTFTNAATQELKGRIRQLIHELWLYLGDSTIQNKIFDKLFIDYRFDKEALLKLQKALVMFDEAAVYSIHGFCQRVLTLFPVETGSLLQQQLIPDETELEQSAIRDYWRKHVINLELNKCRWVLNQWKTPDDLLADVRSLLGFEDTLKKTLIQLELDSIDQDINTIWNQIFELWNFSSTEIQSILLESPALNRRSFAIKTLHNLFIQLEDYFTSEVPYSLPAKWMLLTRTKIFQSLNNNKQDERLGHEFFELADSLQELHASWISGQKKSILIDAGLNVLESINEAKTQAQNISFNDLITRLSTVLTPQNSALIKKINSLYPLAMVDEFQDTDNSQYHIFKMLYQQPSEQHKTLILIGDPKQAIYSFRGADVFTYQQAKRSTDRHFTLDVNYRSTADYIQLLNRVFEFNPNAFMFEQLIQFNASKANTASTRSITENDKALTPLVSWILPYTEKPVSKAEATEYFASICASEIYTLLQQKNLLLDNVRVCAKDLTILVKTGRQASLMKQKLAQLGIASALILRDSVFATEQAREISLLLKVLIEPSDTASLNGLLSSDLFSWNTRQIAHLQHDNQQLVSLLEQIKGYQQTWQQKGILSMFFKFLEDQETLQKNLPQMDGERRLTNWMHIIEVLQQQSTQHASFGQLLHWLQQQREQVSLKVENEEHQLRLESDSDLVRIVTIHKSKGLQYPIVFLPFMWDVRGTRNMPKSYSYHDDQGHKKIKIIDESKRQRWHEENLAEETRLFYVAMTRAIYRCYLGWGNIKGTGSSAIAQCLYIETAKKNKYPFDLDLASPDELRGPLEEMNRENELVEIVETAIETGNADKLPEQLKGQVEAKEFNRQITQQWRISSYSQMASSEKTDDPGHPDYDAVTVSDIPDEGLIVEDELSRFSFMKGAKAGNFLHDILEHQVFDQNIDEILIRQKCSEYGFEEKWIPCLVEWISDVLACPLGECQLRQLTTQQKLTEMEFYMSSKKLQAQELNKLLHDTQYIRRGQSFNFSTINGFIKGFIDLVFEWQGQYFIADYKSNFLGNRQQHYNASNCDEAMFEHHYHLQYLIYTVALHRYLRQRIKHYTYDQHVGGVYYLFLRGMSKKNEHNHGIYFHKPELRLIQQLDALFDGNNND